uniref:Uncharacterized protein n=1 Tax=Paramormyrops kingsleyae TaxID=1676925 RepID=A0A3B3SSW1_9TELE
MAASKAQSFLITGANRGLGLEMVKQLVESRASTCRLFAACRDPDAPKSQALQDLAKKYTKVITVIQLGNMHLRALFHRTKYGTFAFPLTSGRVPVPSTEYSSTESAKQVGVLLWYFGTLGWDLQTYLLSIGYANSLPLKHKIQPPSFEIHSEKQNKKQ